MLFMISEDPQYGFVIFCTAGNITRNKDYDENTAGPNNNFPWKDNNFGTSSLPMTSIGKDAFADISGSKDLSTEGLTIFRIEK